MAVRPAGGRSRVQSQQGRPVHSRGAARADPRGGAAGGRGQGLRTRRDQLLRARDRRRARRGGDADRQGPAQLDRFRLRDADGGHEPGDGAGPAHHFPARLLAGPADHRDPGAPDRLDGRRRFALCPAERGRRAEGEVCCGRRLRSRLHSGNLPLSCRASCRKCPRGPHVAC